MYICQEPDQQQLELFERSLPFDGKLDRGNRWIRLAHTLNWRELECSYAKLFAEEGHPGIRARYVLGTLILKKKSIAARIVSLHKSYVRPIVRGKNGKEVEFGAKVELSCVDGYLFADHISVENFNESAKLEASVSAFQNRFEKLPEYVAMDKIYGTRENRKYLEEKGIRASVKPLGRRKKEKASNPEERWRKRKQRECNRIEGAIGNSKTYHDMGIVRSKTPKTEKSWIQMALFSRNLLLAATRN